MYEVMSLADLYRAFLKHHNLFQAIENYVTPDQTSKTLQKVIDWSDLKREIFICYEGQMVQVVAKTKRQKLYLNGNLRVNHVKRMQPFNCTVYVLQMDNMQMLMEGAKSGASIYAQLKATEIEDRSLLQKPFEQVDSQDVTRMIFKWLSERSGKMTTVPLRIKDHYNVSYGITSS